MFCHFDLQISLMSFAAASEMTKFEGEWTTLNHLHMETGILLCSLILWQCTYLLAHHQKHGDPHWCDGIQKSRRNFIQQWISSRSDKIFTYKRGTNGCFQYSDLDIGLGNVKISSHGKKFYIPNRTYNCKVPKGSI